MHYEFTIKALSPLHIGSSIGEIRALSFIVRRDTISLSSEAKLAQVLHQEGLIDSYVNYIQNGNRPSLNDFIQTLSNPKQRTKVETGSRERLIRLQKGERTPLAIRPLQMDPLTGQLALPGSSVKGALRVSLLHQLCEDEPRVLQDLLRNLDQIRNKKRAGERLDQVFLQNGGLQGVKGPNQDWFRTVQVSDSFANASQSLVVPVKILSLNNDNRGHHLSANGSTIYVETFQPGTEFKIPVAFDETLFDEMKNRNHGSARWHFEEWLEGMEHRFQQLMEADITFATRAGVQEISSSLDKLQEQGANFRLGWGSGLLSTSVDLLVPIEKRKQIREKFFPRRTHPEFPQSRKIVFAENNRPASLLGYCRLDWKRVG